MITVTTTTTATTTATTTTTTTNNNYCIPTIQTTSTHIEFLHDSLHRKRLRCVLVMYGLFWKKSRNVYTISKACY